MVIYHCSVNSLVMVTVLMLMKMMVMMLMMMMVMVKIMMRMMVIVWLRALPVSIVAPSACQAATRKAEQQCWQELGIGLKT